jgi:DNA polymerase III epsilon subunit-like protein
VIEIGVCRLEGGRCVAEYEQLIDPERKISPGVTAITGITQSMVAGQPKFTEQLPRLLPLLQGAIVLGHNVRFDLGFLRREFRRAGQELTAALGEGVHVMDTVRIARRRFGRGGNALQSLAPRLGYQPDTAHRALADAKSTAFVFEKLMEPVGGWDVCLCDAIKEQGGPMGLMPVSPRESLLPLELEEALEQRCAVMMEYLDARQKRTQRVIEPLTVRRSGGELLMVAFCHMRQERRTFKLDRIVRLDRVGPSSPPLTPPTTPPAVEASVPEALAPAPAPDPDPQSFAEPTSLRTPPAADPTASRAAAGQAVPSRVFASADRAITATNQAAPSQ